MYNVKWLGELLLVKFKPFALFKFTGVLYFDVQLIKASECGS